MSGLDAKNFDLFSKKPKAAPPKPIEVKPATPVNVQKAVEEFDAEEGVVVKAPVKKVAQIAHKKIQVQSKAKFDTYVPVTTRISQEEYMGLKGVENTIMRSRTKGNSENRERITFNSVMRCLVKNFLEKSESTDLSEIQNEEELNDRIKAMFQ